MKNIRLFFIILITFGILGCLSIPSKSSNKSSGQFEIKSSNNADNVKLAPSWDTWVKTADLYCTSNKKISVLNITEESIAINFNKVEYTLPSVPTTTGALRYEDKQKGIAMLLLPAKVSLFNTKTNQRLADECRHM